MKFHCSNCGWLEVNPSGAMFCGYSDERTSENESCSAWKDKEEPQTNGDRIRAMTDEELANFLMDISIHGGIHIDDSTTRWSIYEWLKKEVDE